MSRADRFLRACRREAVDCTPVWMMRQAGRYLPEYRAIREKHTFLEMCRTPAIAAEVTVQPMRRFDLDAAIIFADILLPLPGIGLELSFGEGEGPAIGNPVRTRRDVEALAKFDPEKSVPFLLEAIRLSLRELDGKAPLIGFAGAPFTLASYMIEGGGSRNYENTKALMYSDPQAWRVLMEKLVDTVAAYLSAQVRAGVHALQVFDSWIGCLSKQDYLEFVLPHMKALVSAIGRAVPVIHFANGASHMLPGIRDAGGDVISVDWHIGLDDAWKAIGYDRGIQGNLDPVTLLGPREFIEKRVADVLLRAGGRAGHVFNLGHGLIPSIPPENVGFAVDKVHELSVRTP
ncbi:MAG: uroporphyrinogen decarboxylase [Deltaproteobacteria bacterium]|nr:uroporphyrinogen decarboxylase [Deltaproteobacteria bacterium]